MKITYSVSQAQSQLPSLVREAAASSGIYGIKAHDEVRAYLVGRERMEAIIETLEILSNPEAREAIRDYEAGKTEFIDFDPAEDS